MDGKWYNGRSGIEIGDMEFIIQISISPAKLADNKNAFHSHSVPELIVIDYGTAEIEFGGGTSITVTPGTICHIPAGTIHRTKPQEGNPIKISVGYAYVQNKRRSAESVQLYKSFDSVVKKMVLPSTMDDSVEIGAILSWIAKNGNDRSYLSSLALKARYQILGVDIIRLFGVQEHLHGSAHDTAEQTKFLRMKDIESWLDFWYSHSVSESWLSGVMNLSKRQINRLFHEYFNMSFRDKLTEVRLSHAVDYLMATDMKIDEIAYKVGYSTAAGFQNAFSKKYGISPGKYRKENCKKT